jgi:hypothetical protein
VALSDKQKKAFGELATARMFVAISTSAAPLLTQNDRAKIQSAAETHFNEDEWQRVALARELFAIRRNEETNGVTAKDLAKKLTRLDAAADALLDAITVKNKTDEIALARLRHIEPPAFDFDAMYPMASDFRRRAHLALRALQMTPSNPFHAPWNAFVQELAKIFELKGLKVPRSKPADHREPPKLGAFAKFVFAVNATLPDHVRPDRKGTAADVKAIVTALPSPQPCGRRARSVRPTKRKQRS